MPIDPPVLSTVHHHRGPVAGRRPLLAGGLVLAAGVGGRAALGAEERVLRVAVSAPPANLDPQYYTLTPSNMVAAHMFERLIRRTAALEMEPGLAESWRVVDETTWEFTLRDGVRFHDGTPLTAEDVAYTIARAPKVPSPSSFAVYTRAIAGVEIMGPRVVRLRTAGPYPLLAADVANLFILPRTLGDNVPSSDFNTGKAAIGTGPFRFESYKQGDELVMVRNPTYWGPAPIWDRVVYRVVSNSAARVAALLSGDVQLIDSVPTTDAAKLRTDTRVAISEAPSLRLIYLALDVFRDVPLAEVTGPNGERLTSNPFKDLRVRRALSMAVNRAAIVERTMEGAATAAGQFMPEGTFGWSPDLPPPAFDPAGARALLAEAGYAQGFAMVLHGPNDRYVNDAQILQVIAQQWSRIGVRATVNTAPLAILIGRASRFECGAYLLGWSNSGGEPSTALRAILGTRDEASGRGLSNYGRYGNPTVDALTDEGLRSLDDAKRERLMREAMAICMREVGIIPLHLQKSVWATRRGLAYEPRIDELTLARSVSVVDPALR